MPATAMTPAREKVGSANNNWESFPPIANEAPIPIKVPDSKCIIQRLSLGKINSKRLVRHAATNIPIKRPANKKYLSILGQSVSFFSKIAWLRSCSNPLGVHFG